MKTKLVPFDIEKAKNGAKIVTRSGLSARRVDVDVKDNDHPILCLVTWKNGKETPILYTMNGRYCPDHADDMDLFIEEEVVEEHNNFEIMPDKWYLCTRGACLWLEDGINYTSFMEGVSYLGADILKCNLSFEHEYYQNYFRYWDINDAKDGDVLCYETKDEFRIFIYKNGHVYFHCHYYNEHLTTVDSYFVIPKHLLCYIHPATKEQRELLFKKMKEDGYKWDSDKKELKKIEEVKKRRMTNQELAWWLRDCFEEHREFMITEDGAIFDSHIYYIEETNEPVKNGVVIRRNGGEWEEPLIEE